MKNLILIIVLAASVGIGNSQTVNLSSEWIKNNVVSIDTNAQNFSNLQFLKKEIGEKRIVGLGELNHQGGKLFEERARVVKFLMEEMDFEVILFESGIFDVHYAGELVKQTSDITNLETSLYRFWRVNEMQGLYKYLQKRIDNKVPFEFAGYDSKFTSKYGYYENRYSNELIKVIKENDSTILNEKKFKDYISIWKDIEYGFQNKMLGQLRYKMSKEEIEKFLELSKWISEKMLDINQPKWATIVQSSDADVIANSEIRVLKILFNKKSLLPVLYKREEIMAKNITYLLENEFKDKKVILIGSVAHFLRNNDKLEPTEYSGIPLNKTPLMLNMATQEIKNDLFVIGFTAYNGEYGTLKKAKDKPKKVIPPAKNSIEYQLASANFDLAYVSLSNIADEKFWKSDPSIRIVDYATDVRCNHWNEIFDGLIFIKTMEPATYKRH